MTADRLRASLSPVRLIAAGFVALRIVAVVGLPPWRSDLDTPTYLALDWTGRGRPFFVPLVYQLAGRDEIRVLVQLAMTTAAWLFLAWTVAGVVRRWRPAVFAAVLVPGLTVHVTTWDLALLSESIAFATTAVVLATWIRLVDSPSARNAGWVVVASVPWTFTHQQHAAALVLVVGAMLVTLRWWRARVALGLTVALAGLAAWGVVSASRFDFANEVNLGGVIHDRVLQDPDHARWWEDRGMPPRPEWATGPAFGNDYDWARFDEVYSDEEWLAWLRSDASNLYVRWLVTHPAHTLGAPLGPLVGDDGDGLLTPRFFPELSRPVIPAALQSWVMGDGAQALFVIAAVGGLVAWCAHRHGLDRRFLVPLAVVALTLPRFWLSWHAAPTEPGRHVIVQTMFLRVALVMLVVLALDRLVAHRPDPSGSGVISRR